MLHVCKRCVHFEVFLPIPILDQKLFESKAKIIKCWFFAVLSHMLILVARWSALGFFFALAEKDIYASELT